jgi:SAM-dependent methyltransferase
MAAASRARAAAHVVATPLDSSAPAVMVSPTRVSCAAEGYLVAKGRESEMPSLELWEGFFDPDGVLEVLGCGVSSGDVVEFGCGYGTFTIAAARRASGTVYASDIDPSMVRATLDRAAQAALRNVIVETRDFVAYGCGRPDHSAAFIMLFNILHIEDPLSLLCEARRVLCVGGTVGLIHWRQDINTPRGPSIEIRPLPAQCRVWAEQAGLRWLRSPDLPNCPWHWGMVLERPA